MFYWKVLASMELKDHKICCNLKRKIKCLEKQKRKLIKDLNQDLIRAYESESLEEILRHSRPEILFSSDCQRLKEIIETDVQIRNCKHEQLLAATPDVDTHLDHTIEENKPRPNQAVHKVTELLERACKEISKDDDLYSCQSVGVGSHHDGTKMFHYDEMDFVFLLNHEPETEYSAVVVKNTRGVPAFYVLPVEGTDFYKRCEDERLLRPGGKLDVLSYRNSFIRTLKSTLQRLCDEMNIDCSGCVDFHFSGFMENGPALTFRVNDISVDITLSFKAPQSLMADVMQKNADPQLVRRLEKCFPDFRSLGLLVLPPCGECVLSTSWIETHFIYKNTTLQNTLEICKYYKELYFNLDWPCLKDFYKFLVNKIQDHILCRLQSDEQRAMEVENQIMNMLWQSEEHSILLLFLATRPRPQTIDDNTFSKLLKLHHQIAKSVQQVINSGKCDNVYPSLVRLLDKTPRPVVRTVSFIFKLLILKKLSKYENVTPTSSQLFLDVLTAYAENLNQLHQQEHSDQDKNNSVLHPLLGYRVRGLQKMHRLSGAHKSGIAEIHWKNVKKITNRLFRSTTRWWCFWLVQRLICKCINRHQTDLDSKCVADADG